MENSSLMFSNATPTLLALVHNREASPLVFPGTKNEPLGVNTQNPLPGVSHMLKQGGTAGPAFVVTETSAS